MTAIDKGDDEDITMEVEGSIYDIAQDLHALSKEDIRIQNILIVTVNLIANDHE